ncbi:MAG: hypothetical protein ACI4UO_05830 [Paludibacteraceae bacterium]
MQKTLVSVFRHVPTGAVYAVMSVWLLWYMLTCPRNTRAVYRFHHQHRQRHWWQACADTYRSYYCFGEAIMDRFAAFAGRRFAVEVPDRDTYEALFHGTEGFLMLFSHEGNSEMAGYALSTPDKRMNVLAYMAETETVTQNRVQALAKNNLRLIPMYPNDMGHLYTINEALENGEIVAMAADRIVQGKTIRCRFMDAEANFPAGPFRMCIAAKRPILLVFVLKTRRDTYRAEVQRLEIPSHLTKREEQAAALAQAYADALAQKATAYPYQWFNFYDFWQ